MCRRNLFLTLLLVAVTAGPARANGDTYASPATSQAQLPVEITDGALQTFYYDRTPPHTDRDGNIQAAYQPGVSFFPIGIYFLTPCLVTEQFAWNEPETPPPGWDGTYTLVVNLGDNRNTDDPDLRAYFDRNPTSELEDVADRLPASTQLYYSVWATGTSETVAEGPFVSQACPPGDPDEPDGRNSVEVASQAGFDFTINISRPSFPSVLIDLKNGTPAASDFEFVFSVRRPNGTFRESLFDQYKNNPDVYGWYLDDEPYLRARLDGNEQIEAVYQELLDLYNSHKDSTTQLLFFTEWGRGMHTDPWWLQFIQTGDAASHDNYVKDMTGVPSDLKAIADSVAAQTRAVNEERHSWIVLQAFGSSYEMLANAHRFPTPEEMRAYVYTSIVHGATGIIYFAWDSTVLRNGRIVGIRPTPPPRYPEDVPWTPEAHPDRLAESAALWNSLDASQGGLNAELRSLEPVLLSPTAPQYYQVFVDQDPSLVAPIRTMLKRYGEHHYLFAVNITDVSLDASFVFGDEVRNPKVLFEARTISPSPTDPNALEDHFDPLAVHIYRFERLTSPPAADSDGDGLPDFRDNCPAHDNPDQTNTPIGPIDNGPGLLGEDATNPFEDTIGDACDYDADNDGLLDTEEDPFNNCVPFNGWPADHPNPTGGDVTNDDDGDGDPAPPMGSDLNDNGPSWDTDSDGVLDGAECALGYNPRDHSSRPDPTQCNQLALLRGAQPDIADTDGDGLPDAWEVCGWGTDPTVIDTDGDGVGDCTEAADLNGDAFVGFVMDAAWYARAALAPSPSRGPTQDFDLNGDGVVDFVGDVIQELKFAFIPGLCK